MNGVSEKHHAHELIELLPDSQIATAVRFLEFMLLDPVARAVATAPPDDEPVTEQDRRRFHDGQAWFARRGEGHWDGGRSGRARVQARGLSPRRDRCHPTGLSGSTKPRPMFARWTSPRPCASLKGFSASPAPGSGDVKALHGDMAGASRLRLGDYRVMLTLQDDAMRIFGVRHRSEAYL